MPLYHKYHWITIFYEDNFLFDSLHLTNCRILRINKVYNKCNTSIDMVDSDMAKRGVGQPKKEPTSVRSIRLPDRVWKLVSKESKMYRSVNQYFLSLVENDLIKRKLLKKSERKNSKNKKG